MAGRNAHIDRELLELVASGDEPSFRVLYDHFSAGIYRTACRYLRNAELAEDVVQDTFLTLWANRAKIGRIDSPENYIFVLARNQCFRLLKDRAVLISSEEEFFIDLSEEPAGEEDERFAQISRAIDLLPPQQKKIFEMAKLKGLSHERISRELNLSPSTVNNHITAAFRSVRNYISNRTSEVFILVLALFS
ncbi:MAG: hypothetical protein ABS46_20575 [Cytophagaceae bacterium SCN 52-12]|nr:MAG: hypothetical protein ABS46_20575 [Cytophagaceae bacterium SCN 52-12]